MAVWNPLPASLVLLPLAMLMGALGWWQLGRMNEKQVLIESYDNAPQREIADALAVEQRYARIDTRGRFDPERHIMLDNQVHRGRAGVHVFTPFMTPSGDTILVNRGWKPLPPDRIRLPDVETPDEETTLKGILAPPPEHRQRLGAPDRLAATQWPQLVTYLEIDAVAEALGANLPQRVVWLAPEHPAGFEGRDWSPVVMTPARHQAYAVQWFALALTALVIWVVLLLKHRAAQRSGVPE